MKLQGLGIVFALIVLPIILVMTYYIQLQVDTLILQKKYDSKLLDSTYDALSAFELNTANEDLSTVSDSLRSIVEASSNVFFTTLATNLGMSSASQSHIEPYIPALLFTMYDGYYISAPTQVPTVVTNKDGNAVTVGDQGVSQLVPGVYNYDPTAVDDVNKNNGDSCLDAIGLTNREEFGSLLYETGTAGNYTADIDQAKKTTKNVLKNYMPYSARYQQGSGADLMDVTINYTLDNFVTIEGSIKGEYYTKSGYLIPEDSIEVSVKNVVENRTIDIFKYNQEQAQKVIESGSCNTTLKIKDTDGLILTEISVSCPNVEAKNNSIITYNNLIRELRNITTYDTVESINNTINAIKPESGDFGNVSNPNDAPAIIEKMIEALNKKRNLTQYELDKTSAIVYYTKGAIFSKWVHEELGTLKENSIIEVSGQKYQIANDTRSEVLIYDFLEMPDDSYVFDLKRHINAVQTTERDDDVKAGVTEINKSSTFYRHKYNVIRNSVQYNLNLAMSTYNASAHAAGYDYQMPIMQNDEWEQVLNNVSIVSFMQGIKCGLKKYNNYKVVSSTNNEIVVTPENLFYVTKNEFNDEATEYHRIDCKKLYDIDDLGDNDGSLDEYISFASKEVKYDKQYDENRIYAYTYDHMNIACYDCINDHNNDIINIFDKNADNYKESKGLTRAYYIAIGKARNNIYKMNSFVNSQGFEILEGSTPSARGLNEIKAIEVVVGTVEALDVNETILSYKPMLKTGIGLKEITDAVYSFPANSLENHTLTIDVKPDFATNEKISKTSLFFDIQSAQSSSVFPSGGEEAVADGDIEPQYGTVPGMDDYKVLKDAIFRSHIKSIRVIYK